jgi:deazaflavin-dependent oxidoreductase (nitroreductase family)
MMPGPLVKRALALPNRLYDAGGGRLLGHRFLRLTHHGRRSGRAYRTVLEVVAWRDGEAVVLAGLGRKAQWLRNAQAGAPLTVEIARERWPADHRVLDSAEAAATLADYERRNRIAAPVVRAVLGRLSGVRHDGTDAARRRIVAVLPLVAFRRQRTRTGAPSSQAAMSSTASR